MSNNNENPSFTSLADVSETIRSFLEIELKKIFAITVTLNSPKKIDDDQKDSNLLSVYLYRISENSFMRNQPLMIVNKDDTKIPPLTLDLHYMITSYGIDENNKLAFLGRAMQILYDTPVLQGTILKDAAIIKDEMLNDVNLMKDTNNLLHSSKQLRITHNPITQETITQIWQALEVTMRLAAFYIVAPVEIDSTRIIKGERVKERKLG